MMVTPDGSPFLLPDGRRPLSPHSLGQLDAQRHSPRPPLYDSPHEAAQYAAGWAEHNRTRPVPDTLHPRWRLLPLIRTWRQITGR